MLCLNTNLYAVKLRRTAKALLKSERDESNGEKAVASLHTAEEDAAEEADPGQQDFFKLLLMPSSTSL